MWPFRKKSKPAPEWARWPTTPIPACSKTAAEWDALAYARSVGDSPDDEVIEFARADRIAREARYP